MEHEYEALFRAILELIDKCDTIEELRESVKRIMGKGYPEIHIPPPYSGLITTAPGRSRAAPNIPRPSRENPENMVYGGRQFSFSPPTRGFHIDNPAQKADNRFILNAERGKVYAVF